MHYAFDLKLICGGYAYFRTVTAWEAHDEEGRELRCPSGVDYERFSKALRSFGHAAFDLESPKDFDRWIYRHGWGLASADFARARMRQWLKKRYCIRSALGSFTDVALVSPSTLRRGLRGDARDAVSSRDGKRCLLCDSRKNLTLHHVLAHSRGGETSSRNLVTLCEPCNQRQGTEQNIELYNVAGLTHSLDPSLIRQGYLSQESYLRASQISNNLMQTRCELW